MNRSDSRRAFLARGLEIAGASLAVSLAGRFARALGAPDTSSRPPSRLAVHELRITNLRNDDGRLRVASIEESILSVVSLVGRDRLPLDALAEVFPDDPPVGVIVDARSGLEHTRVLSTRLARALVEMGSAPESVLILDESDADLAAGGYEVAREGAGPFCHGSKPEPGYGDPIVLRGVRKPVRISTSLEVKRMRLAVVGRLFVAGKRMGPFVIDAALGALDEDSRGRARADPELGARVLASPAFAGRIDLVIGDLIEVRLGPPGGHAAAGAANEAKEADEPWRADELLVGQNLFAVERVGHTILSNTRVAQGGAPPAEHPILAAAASLGLPGARMTSLVWRKVSA